MKKNLKLGVIGDIHLDLGTWDQVLFALQSIRKILIEKKVDRAIFLGDTQVRRGYLNPMVITALRSFFGSLPFEVEILVGNHDLSYQAEGIDNISGIFSVFGDPKEFDPKSRDLVEVLERVSVISRPDVSDEGLIFLPYPNKYHYLSAIKERVSPPEYAKILADPVPAMNEEIWRLLDGLGARARESSERPVLFSHAMILGAKSGSETRIPAGLDISIPSNLKAKGIELGFNGHLHAPQVLGDVLCPGSIADLEYSEDPGDHLIYVLDHPSCHYEELVVPQAFRLISIKVGEESEVWSSSDPREAVLALVKERLGGFPGKNKLKLRLSAKKKDLDRVGRWIETALSGLCLESSVSLESTDAAQVRSETISLSSSRVDQLREWWTSSQSADPENLSFKSLVALSDRLEEKLPADRVSSFRASNYRPLRLSWADFKSLGTGEIVLDELGGIVCIHGENAVGKSNLAELEAFALWKATLRGETLFDLPRKNGPGSALVEIEFLASGRRWLVSRSVSSSKKTASSELQLWELLGDRREVRNLGDQSATQEELERLVGSLDLYLSTRYASQFDIDRLLKMKPSELKDVMQKANGSGIWDLRSELAREEVNRLSKELEDQELRIGVLRDQLGEKDPILKAIPEVEGQVEGFKGRLEELELESSSVSEKGQELKDRAEKMRTRAQRISEKRDQLKKAEEDRDLKSQKKIRLEREESELIAESRAFDSAAVIENISKLSLSVDGLMESSKKNQELLDSYRKKSEESRGELRGLEKAISDLFSEGEVLKSMIEREGETRNLLDNAGCRDNPIQNCPFISRAISIKDELPKWQVSLSQIEGKLEELKGKVSAIDDIMRGNKELERKVREDEDRVRTKLEHSLRAKKELEAKLESSKELDKRISEKRHEIGILGEEIKGLSGAIEILRDELEHLSGSDSEVELASLERELEKLREQYKTLDREKSHVKKALEGGIGELGALKGRLEKIRELEGTIEKLEGGLKGLREDFSTASLYLKACSRDGVPYLLLERSIPRLAALANGYLGNEELLLEIYSITETKGGKLRNDPMIVFSDPKGRHPICLSSGYQRLAIGSALRAALAKLMAESTGSTISLFWQDEGFAASDKKNLIKCQGALRRMARDFGRVIYISHQDEMLETADSRVEVLGNPSEGSSIVIS